MRDVVVGAPSPAAYTAQAHEIAALLDALEIALRESGWWDSVAPDAERLASSMPFCVDTMSITEWLQWIFLPRMRELLRARQALPLGCAIRPIALEQLNRSGDDAVLILSLLARIDICLSKPTGPLH
jgi:uncharacterized protein YqcC (DUF446 family)